MASLPVSTSSKDILLQEEFLAIESIFFDRCKSFQKDRRMQIELELCSTDVRLIVEYILPLNYPDDPCVMRVVVSEQIPKDIVREAVDASTLFATDHVGSPMIFDVNTSLVDFINKKLLKCNKAGLYGGIPMSSNIDSTRLVLDEKNAGYYFSTFPVLKRQCSDEVPHFSEENFEAAGFVMYGKDAKEVEYNVWRREMPDILVIHPIDRPTESPLEIHADGVDAGDLKEWMDLYLSQFSVVGAGNLSDQSLLMGLVNWVTSYRELDAADETLEESDEVAEVGRADDVVGMYMLDKLPSVAAMEQLIGRPIATGRVLTIITWGDKKESKAAVCTILHIFFSPWSF
jgi:hypothetical protein